MDKNAGWLGAMMKYIAMLVSLLLSYSAHAASFNCSKARTYVEKTICKHPDLSKLDEEMATAYREKMVHAKRVGSWETGHQKSVHREWLRYERNTCQTQQCILRAYQAYLGKKPSVIPTVSNPPKAAFGVFEMSSEVMIYQGEKRGWAKGGVTQFLKISPAKETSNLNDLSAVVNADLIFTNAHLCTLENEPVAWYDNHFKLVINESDFQCELRLYPSKGSVYLKDVDHNCRLRFCGARGGFHRMEITRRKK